jgi:hypothetical protein
MQRALSSPQRTSQAFWKELFTDRHEAWHAFSWEVQERSHGDWPGVFIPLWPAPHATEHAAKNRTLNTRCMG